MSDIKKNEPQKCTDSGKITDYKSYLCFYKSIIDRDRTSVVICNPEHEIIYMNPAAIYNYEKYGGAGLIGKSLLECHNQEV